MELTYEEARAVTRELASRHHYDTELRPENRSVPLTVDEDEPDFVEDGDK